MDGGAVPAAVDRLVERERELAGIARLLDELSTGTGEALVIEGPAGIGKSSLLAATRALALERGVRVLGARGGELESDYAFGVARQLFERPLVASTPELRRAVLGGAARAAGTIVAPGSFEEQGEGDSADGMGDPEFPRVHGLYWLCANLVTDDPTVICVDDLQWSDGPSLRFLAYLSRRLDGLPLLMVMARRPHEQVGDPGLVEHVAGADSVSLVPLAPLSEMGVGRMIGAAFGAAVDVDLVAACHAASGGNPFLVRSLVRAMQADGIQPTRAATGRVGALRPKAVSRSVLMRLSHLGRVARLLADALAVLGGEADLRDCAAIAGVSVSEAAAAADVLERADLIVAHEPLSFVHPIVCSAVYGNLPAAERDVSHARAGRLVAQDGRPPEQAAAHLMALRPRGDPWVARTLEAAAKAAAERGALDTARTLLRRALAEPPASSTRPDVLRRLGLVEMHLGDPAGTARLLEALEGMEDPRIRAARQVP